MSQDRPGLTVLVVEDHQVAADSLASLLRLGGHRPLVAYGGPHALRLARETPPDLVFLDIGLPGLNGLEVARRLREEVRERQPLLVAVTGHDRDEDRRLSEEAGIHLHLAKPADPEKLMALVNRFSRVLAPPLNPNHGDAEATAS